MGKTLPMQGGRTGMEKQEFKEARVVCLTHKHYCDNFTLFFQLLPSLITKCELMIFDLTEQPSEEYHSDHR